MTRPKAKKATTTTKPPALPTWSSRSMFGVQFGLTDVTFDGALKFQGSLAW